MSVLLSLLFAVFLFGTLPGRAATKPNLDPRYAHWLHEEVNYLITDDEVQTFLHLKSDEDRDKFIDLFWRERNPDLNAPINETKEDYYQRLAYVNSHFGYGNVQDGWRSDRGMVYLTLGKPQQVTRYPETPELRPIEIWFYQNLSGSLPTHFYVLFYKQSAAEDYELYSPYLDRPQKLISSTNAINDDKTAIKLIQRDIDDEAAHVALSLIPGEPVDFNSPRPSLQSDVLLNNIRNFRNLPQTRSMLAARRSAIEGVSHRVVLGEQFSDLSVIATRDPENHASVHYLLRLLHPSDLSLVEQQGGRYYYSLQIHTKVTAENGRVAEDQTQPLADFVSAKDFEVLQGKCFGIEGRLELPAGKYQLNVELTDLATKEVFQQSRNVVVPGAEDRIGVSQIFLAAPGAPQRSRLPHEPFSFAGIRFQPVGSENAAIARGTPLRAIFQIWSAPGIPTELQGKGLEIHYLLGQVDSHDRIEQDQIVDRSSFTPEGSLLVGRDFQTDTLSPGFYRLVVKITDPVASTTTYQTLDLEIRERTAPPFALWTADVP